MPKNPAAAWTTVPDPTSAWTPIQGSAWTPVQEATGSTAKSAVATQQPPSPAPGYTLGGAGRGVLQGLGDMVTAPFNLAGAVAHPINTLRSAADASENLLFNRVPEDVKAGNYGAAFWHGVDGAIPFLGQADADSTDQYNSGQPGAKGQALAREVTDFAAPGAAMKGAGANWPVRYGHS